MSTPGKSSASTADQTKDESNSNQGAGQIMIKYEDFSDMTAIGSGSFGKVFRADYLGTDVAVKEFFQKIPDMPDYDFHKYFERELSMLREARHPNIVQFMGTCLFDSKIYIVTEFVPGGNLKDWISSELQERQDPANLERRKALVSYRLRTSFAIDIARALAYLHARGIIHRDLKLENLLLTENNRIKVCDFGFSRVVAKNESERRRLSFCGTDGYMAPEIILCMDDYDTSVDIFSFGILFLCLMVLKSPRNDNRPEDPPFTRIIPGFGLDAASIEEAIPQDFPIRDKLVIMVKGSVEDEAKKRLSLKDILVALKEVELKIVQTIREEEEKAGSDKASSVLNVGLYSSLSREDAKKALKEMGSTPRGSFVDGTGSTRSSVDLSLIPQSRSASIGSQETITPNPLTRANFPGPPSVPPPSHLAHQPTSPLSTTRPISTIMPSSAGTFRLKHDVPHRFSLIFSSLSLHTMKCASCGKAVSGFMHSHLSCDDCHIVCHKKCARNIPPNCGLKALQAGMVLSMGDLRAPSSGALSPSAEDKRGSTSK